MSKQKEATKKQDGRSEVNPPPKGGPQPMMDEDWKRWCHLVAQAWADEELKRRLIDNPRKVLKEHGIEAPEGVEVRVVENTEEVHYLTLPAKPAGEVIGLEAGQARGFICVICE
jgi:hypothetical protein